MQEGAQMAAWIASDKDERGCQMTSEGDRRRILVSQDRDEIYVTFATYDESYIEYILQGEKKVNPLRKAVKNITGDKESSFLTMHEYGPFITNAPNHMRYFGWLILIIMSNLCPRY